MHFTKPTAKSYIYDAHLSQQEMLQLLMRNTSTATVADMQPYNSKQWNLNRLEMVESCYRAIACIVMMQPLPPDAAYMLEMSYESPVYYELSATHGKGNVINQVYIHDEHGDTINSTPIRI